MSCKKFKVVKRAPVTSECSISINCYDYYFFVNTLITSLDCHELVHEWMVIKKSHVNYFLKSFKNHSKIAHKEKNILFFLRKDRFEHSVAIAKLPKRT